MSVISINGNELDPLAPAPHATGLRLLVPDAKHSNYILLQSKDGPLTDDEKSRLTGLGVIIHEYVSENTYLCGYKPTDLVSIRSLPFVHYVNVYAKEFKVAKSLKPSP